MMQAGWALCCHQLTPNCILTDRVSGEGSEIGRVRLSVCLSVSSLTFESSYC